VAVIVTPELGPTAVTTPVVLTVAHEVELDQLTELVTIFVPLSKVAVAVNCCGVPTATASVLEPPCVTATEFGWFTKNPLQPEPTASKAKVASAAIATSLFPFVGRSLDIRKNSTLKDLRAFASNCLKF
jgi:hypothetical protein